MIFGIVNSLSKTSFYGPLIAQVFDHHKIGGSSWKKRLIRSQTAPVYFSSNSRFTIACIARQNYIYLQQIIVGISFEMDVLRG